MKLSPIIILFVFSILLSSCVEDSNTNTKGINSVEQKLDTFAKVDEVDVIKDPIIVQYIKDRKCYVALTDLKTLPIELQAFYKNILIYFSNHNMNVNNYYVSIFDIY